MPFRLIGVLALHHYHCTVTIAVEVHLTKDTKLIEFPHSTSLSSQMAVFFDEFDPEGELFCAPLDVTLTSRNVVQPDILFVSSSRIDVKRKDRIDGLCDLVVEIMSPTTRRRDRVRKMEIYRQAGIPHYWLADLEESTLEAFVLKEDLYTLVFAGGPGDEFSHPQFPGLSLDLDRIFFRPEESS